MISYLIFDSRPAENRQCPPDLCSHPLRTTGCNIAIFQNLDTLYWVIQLILHYEQKDTLYLESSLRGPVLTSLLWTEYWVTRWDGRAWTGWMVTVHFKGPINCFIWGYTAHCSHITLFMRIHKFLIRAFSFRKTPDPQPKT